MKVKTAGAARTLLPQLCFLFVLALMAGASEWLGEREIVFPEAAAIALGALVAPRLAWNTDKVSIFLLIGICACAGELIVIFVPLPLAWQLICAYIVGQGVLLASGTTFAPLISAVVLPVLLQTRTPVYLAAALGITLLVLLLRMGLEALGLRQRRPFVPRRPPAGEAAAVTARTLFAALLALVGVGMGAPYLACPPLLVAFTEFTRPGSRAMRAPARAAAFLALCGGVGALARGLLCAALGLPLAAAALLAGLAVLALAHWQQMLLPPAAAVAVLALLVPESALALYPVQAACAAALYAAFARLFAAARHAPALRAGAPLALAPRS